jgi:ribonuclease Y
LPHQLPQGLLLLAASGLELALILALVAAAVALGAAVMGLRKARSEEEAAREEVRRLESGRREELKRRLKKRERELARSYLAKAEAREAEIEARSEALDSRRDELDGREAALDRAQGELDRRSEEIQSESERLEEAAADIERRDAGLARREEEARLRLEHVAGLDREEARREVIAGIETEARAEAAHRLARLEEETSQEIQKRATALLVQSLESVPGRVGTEAVLSVLRLPSDEMKGRIIGREGRNIRAIEMATGVDLIVDDTPSAILLSSFDPARRELARRALLALIEDGRIHPARIEEVVERVRADLEEQSEADGEAVAFELELPELHARLHRLIGRMRFLTVQGQSLLEHCRETALIAGHLAGELGLRAALARRAGLLHQVARAREGEGSETVVAASADLALKYGESPEVAAAIRSLDPEVPPESLEARLLALARRISLARPGARRENLQIHLQRLSSYEEIARSFPGVRDAFAVKAGRELRVLLREDETSDEETVHLARKVARQIQKEVAYPGQVKVSVIRETRAIDYAV